MRKWSFAVVAGVLAASVGTAFAGAGPWGVAAVPEIDAGSAVSALSILGGVVALAAERLRRR